MNASIMFLEKAKPSAEAIVTVTDSDKLNLMEVNIEDLMSEPQHILLFLIVCDIIILSHLFTQANVSENEVWGYCNRCA